MANKKNLTVKQLKDRLDTLLKVVRYNQSSAEIGRCETCLTEHPIKDLQAGHFIKRGNLWLKYERTNLLAQCIRCNHFMGGCQDKAGYHIIHKYGLEDFCNLVELDFAWMKLDKKPSLKKEDLIDYYNDWLERNRKVEQELGIKIIPKSWESL